MTVAGLSSEMTFIVALGLACQPEDFSESAERRLRAHLLGAGMEEVIDLEFEAPPTETPTEHPAGWELEVTLPLVIKVNLENEGAHTLDFTSMTSSRLIARSHSGLRSLVNRILRRGREHRNSSGGGVLGRVPSSGVRV